MMQGTWLSNSNKPPIDLRPDHMEMVRSILRSYVPGREIRAYGSRAKWSAHDSSDLDLVVMSDSRIDAAVLGSLRDAFEESDLPFRVDVFDWNSLPESFHTEIKREHSVIVTKLDAPEWSEYSIREFAPLTYGKALPSRSRNANGECPVYGSNGVIGYHDKALTDAPTIIVGRKGTAGAVHFSSSPCWPIDTTFYHEEYDHELARFKFYALSTLGLARMNFDSAVPGLNREVAHSVRIRVPPAEDRRHISRVLGALDRKIELNRRMCQTLEEMARAWFKAWFVDFAPVQDNLKGRSYQGESFLGLSSGLNELVSGDFVDSELGPIPTGWQVTGLDDVADFVNGLALQRYSPVGNASLPVIKIAQLRSEDVGGAARARADLDDAHIVSDGEILFSWSGSLECELWTGGRGAVNQHLFKVVPRTVPKWLCFLAIRHHLPWFRSVAAGKATTMGHIQRHHLAEAKFALPPGDLLRALDRTFGPLIDSIVTHKLESRQVRCLRDAVLPKLISGELRVPTSAAGQD